MVAGLQDTDFPPASSCDIVHKSLAVSSYLQFGSRLRYRFIPVPACPIVLRVRSTTPCTSQVQPENSGTTDQPVHPSFTRENENLTGCFADRPPSFEHHTSATRGPTIWVPLGHLHVDRANVLLWRSTVHPLLRPPSSRGRPPSDTIPRWRCLLPIFHLPGLPALPGPVGRQQHATRHLRRAALSHSPTPPIPFRRPHRHD